MGPNDRVDAYLRSASKVRPWSGPLVPIATSHIAQVLGVGPHVHVAYTSAQQSTSVTIDGTQYLVLDMNQVRLVHWMNCVYRASDPPFRFGMLTIPLLIRRLRHARLIQESAVYLERFDADDRRALSAILSEHSAHSIKHLLIAQQYYVVAHEAAHASAVNERNALPESSDGFMKRVIAQILEFYQSQPGRGLSSRLRMDRQRAQSVASTVRHSPDLQEELFADWVARMIVIGGHPTSVAPLDSTLDAIMLVHCHLLSLERIDRYLRQFMTESRLRPDETQSWHTDIRRDCATWGSALFAQMSDRVRAVGDIPETPMRPEEFDDGRNRAIVNRFEAMRLRHDEIFDSTTDQWMIPSLQSLLDAHGGRLLSNARPLPAAENDAFCRLIDQVLGWDGTPVDSQTFLGQMF
jgi:hypothetical protein